MSTPTPNPDQPITGYHLDRMVAHGGMGEIWQATALDSGAQVAVKRLLFGQVGPQPAANWNRARLLREARALEQLRHPNIVRYLGAGLDQEQQPYLVMEWLDGHSLGQERRSRMPLQRIVALAMQVLEGLAACHEQGVVHRDIKPDNLFLAETPQGGRVKLVDFGLALLDDTATRITRTGEIFGTPSYMPPEQARGTAVDHRGDLYAVGVVLYELCTGKLPFFAKEPLALLLKIVTETPPRPRRFRPDLPFALERAILQAMARDPDKRFATARAMHQALGEADVAAADELAVSETVALGTDGPGASMLSTSPAEYRQVSLLCARPLHSAERVTPVVTQEVEALGGVVQQLFSGEIIGLFGLERTHGDEAIRAVRAGLAVRSQHGDRVVLLAATVHIEVGEGLQFEARDLDRTLQRLADLAPGELTLDAATEQLVDGKVEYRGSSGHETVEQLRADATGKRLILGVETATVGRETEHATIKAALERTLEYEEPEAVLVLAQAGLGKSRLFVDVQPELRRDCSLLLSARPDSSRSSTSYGLVAEAVCQAAGIHVGQPPQVKRELLDGFLAPYLPRPEDRGDALAFIGELVGLHADDTPALRAARADPKIMRERISSAFEAVFNAAGTKGAVVLCLEDLHWADDESLKLCELLLDRLDTTPLFLLACSRPELLERHPDIFADVEATRVTLEPLGSRALRRLLRGILGRRYPRELQQIIEQWSGGNPYFVEELVSWLVSRGLLVRDEAGWVLQGNLDTADLPAGVEGAIQGRLDRLPREVKSMLQGASIFGELFWEGGCVSMGFPDAATHLDRLAAEEYITRQKASRVEGDREFRFRHALMHQVANKMLAREHRPALHLLAAQWLEQVGEHDSAVLARHYQQGNDHNRAGHFFALAGARAKMDGDLEGAAQLFESALCHDPPVAQRSERKVALARVNRFLGRHDQALELLSGLQQEPTYLQNAAHRAEVLLLQGQILYASGEIKQAEASLHQAKEALGGEPGTELIFEVNQALFWNLWVQGRYDEAGSVASAIRATAAADGRPDWLCSASLATAYYNLVVGDLSITANRAADAVNHAHAAGDPYREVDARTFLGFMQEAVGQFDQAMETLLEAGRIADRLKTAHHRASIEACLGHLCGSLGRHEEALQHFEQSVATAQELGDDRTLGISLAGRATALTRQGQPGELAQALEAAQRAVELAVDRTPSVEAEARLALGGVQRALEQPAAALEQARAALEVIKHLKAHDPYEIEILLLAHDALLALGREVDAWPVLDQAHTTLRRRADAMADEAIRESYLHRVAANARVLELWEQIGQRQP